MQVLTYTDLKNLLNKEVACVIWKVFSTNVQNLWLPYPWTPDQHARWLLYIRSLLKIKSRSPLGCYAQRVEMAASPCSLEVGGWSLGSELWCLERPYWGLAAKGPPRILFRLGMERLTSEIKVQQLLKSRGGGGGWGVLGISRLRWAPPNWEMLRCRGGLEICRRREGPILTQLVMHFSNLLAQSWPWVFFHRAITSFSASEFNRSQWSTKL